MIEYGVTFTKARQAFQTRVLFPEAGRLVFAGQSGQLEVDASARGVRERFRARFDETEEEIRSFLRRLDVPLIHVTPEGAVIDQVRAQIGKLARGPR